MRLEIIWVLCSCDWLLSLIDMYFISFFISDVIIFCRGVSFSLFFSILIRTILDLFTMFCILRLFLLMILVIIENDNLVENLL